MKQYLRLLRIEDQYLQVGSALVGGLIADASRGYLLVWILAITCISFSGFIINELTDSSDTDKYSWNKVHVGKKLNIWVVKGMWVVFSVLGLFLAKSLDQSALGMAMWVGATLYSLKPFRFKGRFGLDILAQLWVWWVIPYGGALGANANYFNLVVIVLLGSCFFWTNFYPYQLADFEADLKAKIKPTHVVLGIQTSLRVGMVFGFMAVLLYFGFKVYEVISWSWVFVAMTGAVMVNYVRWLNTKKLEEKTKLMQSYVKVVKPISQLTVLYLLILYLV